MTLWAIVPVKPLRAAKSRLAPVLSDEAREELSRSLLIHTLEVLNQVLAIERILVVSRDSRALTLARDFGARTVTEHGASELNAALTRATLVARGYGVRTVLILPADLPLLDPECVHQVIDRANDPPVVVLSPDRHQAGTNALLSSPPGMIRYGFGPDSFKRHLERAQHAGVNVAIYEHASLALDLDLPADLELFRETVAAESFPVLERRKP